jgi:anti-sigma B factor antagonist
MTERLKIDVSSISSRRGDVAHVVLKGVLDAQTVEAFDAIVEEALRTAPMVVIDLKGLTWISSAGAGALLVASKRAEQQSRGFVLAQPGRHVRDVLSALGLQVLLVIGNTLEEAVAQLKSGAHVKP